MVADKGRPCNPRAKGWGKETFLAALEADPKITAHAVISKYRLKNKHANLSHEVVRWRFADLEFAARYKALMDARSPNRIKVSVTKVDADPSLGDWRLKFCEDLFATGTRLAAAEKSPYSYDHIYQMMTEKYPQYDREFAEMVHLVEMRMCAMAEGLFFQALTSDDNAPKDRAWIASRWLERRDPARWGRQVEMFHTGTVEHKHTVEIKSREERLAALLEDQLHYLEKAAPHLLPAHQESISVDLAIEGEFAVVGEELISGR